MDWKVPDIWTGGDVWIIGGGSSIIEQFDIPESLVQKVQKGLVPISEYARFMEAIHTKHTIGVNVSFLLGDWIDMVFFGDNGFFLKYKQQLMQFSGIRVSCNPLTNKYRWCKYLVKDLKKPTGISNNPTMVSWNLNSGAAAINIAVHAGAKRIFLLGFDMKKNENEQTHWHNEYSETLPAGQRKIRKGTSPYDMHLRGFSQIKIDAEKLGVQIVNVNDKSRITDFEKMNLKEALNYGT